MKNPQEIVHTAASDLQLNDDKDLKLGTGNDYQLHYDSSNTRLELVTTDSDGAGADADVIRIEDGTKQVDFQGAVTVAGNLSAANANGPLLENAASSATNPTLVPDRASATAGIGGTSGDVSIITGGTERLNVDTAGDMTFSSPIYSTNTGGAYISNVAGSATVATLIPNRSSLAGIGGSSGDVSIITSGVERMNFDTAGIITTPQRFQITTGDLSINDTSALATGVAMFGTGSDFRMGYLTSQTPDTMVFGVGTDSRAILVMEVGDAATDFAHAQQTNQTIFVQSANAADTAEWISIAHNQTNAKIESGQGGIELNPVGVAANGETFGVFSASTLLSGMTGATVTATNLIPAGSQLLGVAARVTTEITGCTSFQIGDGTDVDRFGNAIALTAGTTTTNASWTITSTPLYTAATSIVLTAVGGGASFTAGAVRLTIHYFTNTAPTA